MVDRVEVFVDTSYLLASFYNSWTIGARAQLEIDLPAVTEHLNDVVSKKLELPVFRQFWYDGIPDSGPHRYQRTLRHIDGVQLRAGQLIEWGDRRTQKGVDTRLVADMVIHAVRGHIQEIVLVSGDADMIPGVQVAIEHGVRVHLIGFGWDSMSNSLRSACDTVTVLDPRDDFEECMHIEVLDSFNLLDEKNAGVDGEELTDGAGDGTADPADGDGTGAGTGVDDADSTAPASASAGLATASDPSEDREAPDVHHSVPLIPPVLSPGKVGGRSAPNRIRTQQHAVADDATDEAAGDSAAAKDATNAKATPKDATKNTAESTDTKPAAKASTKSGKSGTKTAKASAKDSKKAAQDGMPAGADAAKDAKAAQDAATPLLDANSHGTRMRDHDAERKPPRRPLPSMMTQKRRPMQRSRYVPLPYDEVWESAGNQTPYDIGQQYAIWWYNNAATSEQRANAHTLTGGGLPTEVDRPLLQFACQTLDAYTLSDSQRVNLRDGFHMGIRGILVGH